MHFGLSEVLQGQPTCRLSQKNEAKAEVCNFEGLAARHDHAPPLSRSMLPNA